MRRSTTSSRCKAFSQDKTRERVRQRRTQPQRGFFGDARSSVAFLPSSVPQDDLLLLYYSGHGIRGRGNRLFLATAGSDLDMPRQRSISAKEIREFVADCRAERQIVVLDCCHSGAFAEHGKAGRSPPTLTSETFSGGDDRSLRLTAADALQFAWDGAELRAGRRSRPRSFSRFTSWLVDGSGKGAMPRPMTSRSRWTRSIAICSAAGEPQGSAIDAAAICPGRCR